MTYNTDNKPFQKLEYFKTTRNVLISFIYIISKSRNHITSQIVCSKWVILTNPDTTTSYFYLAITDQKRSLAYVVKIPATIYRNASINGFKKELRSYYINQC